MQKIKVISRFLLGFPLTIIALYFIGNFIFKNLGAVTQRLLDINLVGFGAGLIFLLIFFLFRSIVWNKLLESEGFSPPAARSIYLLSISEIKRYIPGSILGFFARIDNFGKLKVPLKKVVKLIFFESVIFVITSSVLSIPGIIYISQKNGAFISNYFYQLLISIAVILAASIAIYLYSKKIRDQIKETIRDIKYFKVSSFYMFVAWIFFGLGNFFIAASINYVDPGKIIPISSYFILSWIIGYLIIIAPLGLGVREAVITAGLSPIMPLPLAAAIAIISRFALVLTELIFLGGSFVFFKFIKIKREVDYHLVILWSAIATYASYFSYVSFEKYANFFNGRFDLGNMDQTVWNTLNGRIFLLTNPDGIQVSSRLAFHADFLLILLAPFYLIWNDARMLLLIQSIVLGLGAFFVYLLSQKIINNKNISLVLAASYLLNPFVQKQNLFDFHAVTLATCFLLASFYFAYIKKYVPFLVFLFLTVLTKENLYAVSFLFGIYLLIRDRNPKWIILSILSVVIFLLLFLKFIPAARGSEHFALQYYSDFGTSPLQIGENMILKPGKIFNEIFKFENFDYLYKLFLPVGFLPVLFPLFIIFALPDLLINILSNNSSFLSINFHYDAAIVPFIYISTIFAVNVLLKKKIKYFNTKTVAAMLLFFALFSTYNYGTLPGSKYPSNEIYTSYLPERNKIDTFLKTIPANLSVASSNNLGAHLSHREKIYTIPRGMYDADIVLFLLNDSYAQPSLPEQKKYVVNLKKDKNYTELYEIGDFVAFAKKGVKL